MKHHGIFICILLGLFGLFSLSVINAGDKPKIGDTIIFAGDFAPRGWSFCDGKRLDISANQELYSQMGVRHGGDARESFYLPNLEKLEQGLNGVRFLIAVEGLRRNTQRGDADNNQTFIGEITVHSGETAPQGWAFCDGQTVRASDSPELANILGSRFGGDGVSTIGLPDLSESERTMNGLRYIIALQGTVPQRN